MGLVKTEDAPIVKAAASEFIKLCCRHGLSNEQIAQVAIAVGGSALLEEADGDSVYLRDLVKRFVRSLRSGVAGSPRAQRAR